MEEEGQKPLTVKIIERLAQDLTWHKDNLMITYNRNANHLTKLRSKIEGILNHLNENTEKANVKADLKKVQDKRSIKSINKTQRRRWAIKSISIPSY